MPDSPQTWLQQPGESDEWYARFLCYLHMGAARSVLRAYRKMHPDQQPPAKEASGPWRTEARERGWRGRANDWDTCQYAIQFKESAVAYGEVVRAFARKLLRAMRGKKFRPTSWPELLEAFRTFAGMVTPEWHAAIMARAAELSGDKAGEGEGEGEAKEEFLKEALEDIVSPEAQRLLDGGPGQGPPA